MKKNSKTQILTQLKLLQNSKTQIVTKLTNSICDKTQIMTQLKTVAMVTVVTVVIVTVVSVLEVTVVIVTIFSKNNLNILTTEDNFEGQRFAILAMFRSHSPPWVKSPICTDRDFFVISPINRSQSSDSSPSL